MQRPFPPSKKSALWRVSISPSRIFGGKALAVYAKLADEYEALTR